MKDLPRDSRAALLALCFTCDENDVIDMAAWQKLRAEFARVMPIYERVVFFPRS